MLTDRSEAEGGRPSSKPMLLIAQADVSEMLRQCMDSAGWRVLPCHVSGAADATLAQCRIGIVHFDRYNSETVMLWEKVSHEYSDVRWIALVSDVALADIRLRELIAGYFYDYHTLPVDIKRLRVILGHAHGLAQLSAANAPNPPQKEGEFGFVGQTPPIVQLRKLIRKSAQTDSPVLICGESGTGKELVASAIHAQSRWHAGPFAAVNCAALPGTLIQSELFGHEKGSFTGAHAQRIGRIEAAAGGTLFLDEIGDLSRDLQVNLLRFLQEKTILRIGGQEDIPVVTRVVAATHVKLEHAIKAGTFREDLFYRLNVIRIEVPPLRERQDDIELLARHFLIKYGTDRPSKVTGFSTEALQVMRRHSWPGNVRELGNRIRNALVVCEGRLIRSEDLGLHRDFIDHQIISLESARAEAEQKIIMAMMEYTQRNVSESARRLGVTRATLYRLISKHNLESSTGILAHKGNGGAQSAREFDSDDPHMGLAEVN